MGLLDELARQMLGDTVADSRSPLLIQSVLQMLTAQPGGGLAELAQRFQQRGLGEIVASWIGTGENLPISAQQLAAVLGSPEIAELARRAGVGTQQAAALLAQLLPVLIDRLTPNGTIPATGGLLDIAAGLLRR